jgi:type IV pilus assembly protein PilQ
MRAKLAWALLTVVALAVSGAPASGQDHTAITDIRQENTDRSTRLVVDCTGPVSYTYYSPDPLTVVVDLPEVDASKVPTRINVSSREVESVRVTSMARADGRGITRLEVRLANLVPYQVYSKDKKLNLVFERGPEAGSGKAAEAKTAPQAPDTKAEPVQPPARTPLEAETTPSAPSLPGAKDAEPARPAPSVVSGEPLKSSPATRILAVNREDSSGQLAFTIKADGRLKYQDFFLGNPDRLVVDFQDVTNRAGLRNLDVQEGPVKKVRIAQFSVATPKVARLVLDLNTRAPYRIVDGTDGIKILFGEGGHAPSPAPLAALRAASPAAPAAAPAVAPAPSADGPSAALPVPILPDLPQAPPGPPLPTKESFEAKTVGAEHKVYTGHPISLDFKDGDLQDIFRLFADISGLNVVVNPGVSGKVTLKLTDVPWDQALDLILKANGLGYTLEDNVLRIAKLSDLQREEQDKRKLEEEKALAGTLEVWRKPLSYAKAADLQPTLQKVALSARGTITLDARTNTMIITDLPAHIQQARDLIADLDRATPQVEIEARIVVTSRNFTRDLGIQWGFLQQRTPEFGNTTSKTFPHSIILNGQGVPRRSASPPTRVAASPRKRVSGRPGVGMP